jgi:hypothetical protein
MSFMGSKSYMAKVDALAAWTRTLATLAMLFLIVAFSLNSATNPVVWAPVCNSTAFPAWYPINNTAMGSFQAGGTAMFAFSAFSMLLCMVSYAMKAPDDKSTYPEFYLYEGSVLFLWLAFIVYESGSIWQCATANNIPGIFFTTMTFVSWTIAVVWRVSSEDASTHHSYWHLSVMLQTGFLSIAMVTSNQSFFNNAQNGVNAQNGITFGVFTIFAASLSLLFIVHGLSGNNMALWKCGLLSEAD